MTGDEAIQAMMEQADLAREVIASSTELRGFIPYVDRNGPHAVDDVLTIPLMGRCRLLVKQFPNGVTAIRRPFWCRGG